MKVLVTVERSPKHRFLVRLHKPGLVKEVKKLVNRKKYACAIVTALSRGIFEKEVLVEDVPYLDVSLILSENSANWDISEKVHGTGCKSNSQTVPS
jgi:rRNA pseudouridine-1189 N-methylase Emg1 (Nep1/Mra1 family)